MDSLQTISNDLVNSITEKEKKKSIPYDTYAKVIRIDGGTAWVHIPGGVDETPVALTVNAKVGDSVLVRVSGGNAWIVGNSSAPPTDDTKAVEAKGVADVAQVKAESAEEIAKDASRAVKSTGQYFWHTETDTGAGAGVHITEVPQEDFLNDPANGGGNLLAQSGGIAIRDGLTELASFGSTTYIGKKGTSNITIKLESESYTGFKDGRLAFLEWAENNGALTPSEIGTIFCTSGSAVSDSIGLYCGQQNGSTQIDTQFEANEVSALIQVTESQNVSPYADLSRSRIYLDKNKIAIESNSVDVNNVTVDSVGNVKVPGTIKAEGHTTAIGYKTGHQTGTYSLATGTTFVTVPASALSRITLSEGTWIIHAHAAFESNNTGRRTMRIYSVTSSEGLTRSFVNQTATNGAATNMNTMAIVDVGSTDITYTIQLAQNSGSAKSVDLILEAVRIA